MNDMTKAKHAVVIGGSMAGLLAARVLADHFERVTVVERDGLEEYDAARKGVPQGSHVHGLWARGLEYLESLLPGLTKELVLGGALSGDVAGDMIWHQFGSTKSRAAVGVGATTVTRPRLERCVRQRVQAHPRIGFMVKQAVSGLVADAARTRITGVRLESRQHDTEQVLDAYLVMDASGRSGLTTRWLVELGYDSPPESKVRIDLTYVTRYFQRAPGPAENGYVIVAEPPAGKRAGVCFAVEDDRWILTLAGLAGEVPPADEAGFLEYARSLPLPHVYEIARSAEPIGEVSTIKFPANQRRHYERLRRFPEGLLVIGDALTSFNPAYGQGMTVAALEAEVLQRVLARASRLDAIAKPYFKQAAAVIDVPWMITTGEDLRYPEVEGERPFLLPLINAYMVRVHHAAATDPAVCRAFFEVASMRKRPEALFAPSLVARTVLASAGGLGGFRDAPLSADKVR